MNARFLGVGLVLMAAAAAPLGVMGWQTTAPTTAAVEVTQCAQAQMAVDRLLAAAMARIDGARQANTAADLRAAVDSLQNTMRDVRAQLAVCASMRPAGEAPMDHSKMPMGPTPAKPAAGGKPEAPSATDPVCGLKVDPAVAPYASHEGKSYSFCSEQHRELFQKNPAKYLPKGK